MGAACGGRTGIFGTRIVIHADVVVGQTVTVVVYVVTDLFEGFSCIAVG